MEISRLHGYPNVDQNSFGWRRVEGGGQRLEYEKEDNINSIMKLADGKCCLAMTVDISL